MATVQGTASAAATSVAIPTHAVGDLILVFARGTAAAPSIPSAGGTVPAWTSLQSGLANSIGLTAAYFVATATTTTTGTWTNATHICVLVLRPGSGKKLQTAVANSSVGNGNNTQTIVYPALTLGLTDGSSWGVRCGTRTVAVTAVGTAPASWTNQIIQPAGASALMSVHTRSGLTANPTADSVSTAGTNAAYRAVTIEVQEVSLNQTITVGGVSSAQSFGTCTIAPGRVTVAVPGCPPNLSDLTITGSASITGQETVGWTYSVGQFGAPTAFLGGAAQNVSVGGVGSAQSFGSIYIRRTAPNVGVNSAQAFGAVTVKSAITRTVGAVASAQSFGAVTPKAIITRSVSAVSSAQSFGAVTAFNLGGGAQFVPVGAVSSGQSFGTPTIKTAIVRSVGGVSSAQTFGTVLTRQTGVLNGVNSAQQFGVPTIKTAVSKAVGGVVSAQSFGTPAPRLVQIVHVAGIDRIDCTPIVGLFIVGDGHIVGGLPACRIIGIPTVFTRQFIRPVGLDSAQQFGTLTPLNRRFVYPPGLGSAQQFGTVSYHAGPVTVVVGGLGSAGQIGVPHIAFRQFLFPPGLGSAQAFGIPDVFLVRLHPIICTDLDLALATCLALTLSGLTSLDLALAAAACTDVTLTAAPVTTIDLEPAGCQ